MIKGTRYRWKSVDFFNPIISKNQLSSENHLNSIRLLLAFLVMLAHLAELSQKDCFNWVIYLPNSYTAINSFFVISGFLVFRSYERSADTKQFWIKRWLRIYPAYVIVIFFGALLGAFLTNISLIEYVSSSQVYMYIGYNLLFLNFMEPALPGVFMNNYIDAINGSLWTLKIEVMFYLSVPPIMFMTKYIKRDLLFTILFLLSVLYLFVMLKISNEYSSDLYYRLSKQLPGQLMYFIFGALVYYYFDALSKIPFWVIVPFGILYCIAHQYNQYYLFPLCLSGIIFPLAFSRLPYSPDFLMKNDVSYGLYLFHFPVIQWFCDQSIFENPILGFLLFLVCISLISYASWILVEKKVMQRNKNISLLAGIVFLIASSHTFTR